MRVNSQYNEENKGKIQFGLLHSWGNLTKIDTILMWGNYAKVMVAAAWKILSLILLDEQHNEASLVVVLTLAETTPSVLQNPCSAKTGKVEKRIPLDTS